MSIGADLVGIGQGIGGLIASSGAPKARDMVLPVYDPRLDQAFQASQFAGLSGIGFGDINSVPDPIQGIVGRIQSLPIDEKTKRRALLALQNINDRASKAFDARGTDIGVNDPKIDRIWGSEMFGPRLDQALSRLGLDKNDIAEAINSSRQQTAQRARFQKENFQKNEDIVRSRFGAAHSAAKLLGSAADFASTGVANDPFQKMLFEQDNRQMADLQDRLGVLANFGGINPATMFEQLTDAGLNQNLRVLERALGASGAIASALNPALAAAQPSTIPLNAAQISSQQATAANALRAQVAQDKALSMANGVANAFAAHGQGVSNAEEKIGSFVMSRLGSMGQQSGGGGFWGMGQGGSGTSAGLNPGG